MPYYEHYEPRHPNRFEQLLEVFSLCETEQEFGLVRLAFILDMNYDRQDLLVAWGRVAREKHWDGH